MSVRLRIRALLPAALLLLALLPLSFARADTLSGEGFSYENGILIIASDEGLDAWLAEKSELPVTRLCLQNAVTHVPYMAFYRQTQLRSLAIGAGLDAVGPYAFSGCDALSSITVVPENARFHVADGVLYADGTHLMLCPRDREELIIPAFATSVEPGAFDGCLLLEAITFEGSLPLEEDAFGALSSLRRMAFLGAPPVSVSEGLFARFMPDFSVICTGGARAAFAPNGETEYYGAPLASICIPGALPSLASPTPVPTPEPTATPVPTPDPTPEPTPVSESPMSRALGDALKWFSIVLFVGGCAGLWVYIYARDRLSPAPDTDGDEDREE